MALATHFVQIPGIRQPIACVATSDEEAIQMACELLGLHFLPPGTITTRSEPLSAQHEDTPCSSAT